MLEAALPAVVSLSTVTLATGGIAIILISAFGVVGAGTYLMVKGTEDTIKGIENELKAK